MSDEIPVGSPPAPPGRHAAPGGWYADPASQGQERYWDGWQWTRNTRPTDQASARSAPGQNEPARWAAGQQIPPNQWDGAPGMAPVNPYGRPGAYQRPVPMTADGVPLAGWWWRVLAFVIDWILVTTVTEVISQVTGLSAVIQRGFNAYTAYLQEVITTGTQLDLNHALSLITPPEFYLVQGIGIVVFVIYHAVMLRLRGATLGKLATGLRVVPVDQGRASGGLSWALSVWRPSGTQLLGLLPLLSLVDSLFPLWDRRRQTLHDKLARTQVVKIR